MNNCQPLTRPHTLFGGGMGFGGRYLVPALLPQWIGTHSRGIAKQGIARERCSTLTATELPLISL
jgi:hypothetical protein